MLLILFTLFYWKVSLPHDTDVVFLTVSTFLYSILVGFFISVMWSIIISLALNSVEHHHGSFSGILVTGIAGGAIIPLIVGSLGDLFGLKAGMFFLFITLAYILSIGFWSKPLVNNEIVGIKKSD